MEAGVHAAFPLPNQTFLPSSPPCWTCLSPGPAELANISSPGWRNPRLARLDSAFKPTLIWAPVVLMGLQMEAQCAWCLDHGEETKTLSVIHQFLPIHRVLGLGNQIDENEVPVLRKLPVHQGSRKEGWDREVIIEARGQWTGDVFGKTPQGFAFASPLLTITSQTLHTFLAAIQRFHSPSRLFHRCTIRFTRQDRAMYMSRYRSAPPHMYLFIQEIYIGCLALF